MTKRICVFDAEANGFLETVTKQHCAVFIDIKTGERFLFRPHEMKAMCDFMDTCEVLIGHNCYGYDFPMMKKLHGYTFKGKVVDTLVMSRLLNPKRQSPINCPNKKAPHSVEAWGYRVGRGKPEHNDWENFSEEMLHRCVEDAEIQFLIYKALMKEAHGKNWKNAFLLTFKLFENLQRQEEYGWKVDKPWMEKCISILNNKIRRIDERVVPLLPIVLEKLETTKAGEVGFIKKPFLKSGEKAKTVQAYEALIGKELPVGGPFSRVMTRTLDIDSAMELKDYLLKLGWEPLEWNTNDEGERTSPKLSKEDPFDGVEGIIGKLVARRVQCKQRRSIIEGLLKTIRPDGAIPSVVNNLTDTARATHRNIVNIPKVGSFFGRHMRRMFIARDGMILVGTDSDQCQLRMLGARMGSEAYIRALTEGDKSKGTDLHSMTRKIADLDSRDTAKTTMYCLLFGGGDTKLGKSAKKPGQGAEIRAKLYKGFDGLGELMERLIKEWRATAKKRWNQKWNKMEYYQGSITGLDGRPIVVPYEHQLLVYLLQSDEAIMMAAAYNRVHQLLEKEGLVYGVDFGMVCWYHDEFTIETWPKYEKVVKQCAEEAIAWAARFYKIACPHIGDAQSGRSWYEIH